MRLMRHAKRARTSYGNMTLEMIQSSECARTNSAVREREKTTLNSDHIAPATEGSAVGDLPSRNTGQSDAVGSLVMNRTMHGNAEPAVLMINNKDRPQTSEQMNRTAPIMQED
jgi:hypothetical protein